MAARRDLAVLVVEDSGILREHLGLLLAQAGHEAVMAEDGAEAIRAVEADRLRPFDLILMDIRMPGIDGLAATRRIRELGFTMPILAVTAELEPGQEAACAEAGMDGFLRKPVRRMALFEAIRTVVGPDEDGAGG